MLNSASPAAAAVHRCATPRPQSRLVVVLCSAIARAAIIRPPIPSSATGAGGSTALLAAARLWLTGWNGAKKPSQAGSGFGRTAKGEEHKQMSLPNPRRLQPTRSAGPGHSGQLLH